MHATVNRLHHDLVNVRGAHEAIRLRTQQAGERLARIGAELEQADDGFARDEADLKTSRQTLASAEARSAELERQRPALESERESHAGATGDSARASCRGSGLGAAGCDPR